MVKGALSQQQQTVGNPWPTNDRLKDIRTNAKHTHAVLGVKRAISGPVTLFPRRVTLDGVVVFSSDHREYKIGIVEHAITVGVARRYIVPSGCSSI